MASATDCTATYDANGNSTHDNVRAYTWDAEGHAITIDTIGLSYDALGRMVEQYNGSSYTQILYGPTGKLALMNGQSVTKAFIPLPAGATAVYTSGPTLSYFRHPDWLGTSRFASTASRTMYYSGAYAPFGETYSEAGTTDRSFTGQNQDTVPDSTAGLYDFMYREYAQYGRWISPDPAGRKAVNIANPQSWNRYAYVLNSPLNRTDPTGLCGEDTVGGDDGGDPGPGDDTGGGGGGGGGDVPDEVAALEYRARRPRQFLQRRVFSGRLIFGQAHRYQSGACPGNDNNPPAPPNPNPGPDILVVGPDGSPIQEITTITVTAQDPWTEVGMPIFTNNDQCPTCGNLWSATAGTINDLALVYVAVPAVVAAPEVAVGVSAAAETYGIPVTAMSVWTINNWTTIQNAQKIVTWTWGQLNSW